MPLAVYYELAAHLRQVSDLTVEFLPQAAQSFNYSQSQVGGLALRASPQMLQSPIAQRRIQQILSYYSQRYASQRYTALADERH